MGFPLVNLQQDCMVAVILVITLNDDLINLPCQANEKKKTISVNGVHVKQTELFLV